jgi:uncharacterized membrane protein
MTLLRLASLLLLLVALACSQPKEPPPPTVITDTLKAGSARDTVFIDSSEGAPVLSGFFQGMLPCDGCEGIQHTLLFYGDRLYRAEVLRWAPKASPQIHAGQWAWQDSTIVLYEQGQVIGRYRLADTNTLLSLTDTATFKTTVNRRLARKNAATDNEAWTRRQMLGIDFYGLGNEPFWNIEIDHDKFIRLQLADRKQPIVFPPVMPASHADSVVYQAAPSGKNKDSLSVLITKRFCSDGMSDYLYAYRVYVRYGKQQFQGCGVFLNLGAE